MSLILKQETTGSVTTPPAGRSTVFVDENGQLGVKQPSGTSVVTGNITAVNLDGSSSNVLYGNGTFAPASGGSSYGNSNVVTLLSSFGSNTIVTTGNISGGNINTVGGVYANGRVFGLSFEGATANIGSLHATLTDTNIAGNLSASSNLTVGSTIVINGSTSNVSGVGKIEAFALDIGGGGTTTQWLSVSGTANLGAVGNVIIAGGSSGQVLSTDGAGNLSWATQSGGSANLEAVNTDILPTFDDVFDIGSSAKRWNNVYSSGTVVGNTVSGTNGVFTAGLVGNVVTVGNSVYALNTYGVKGTLNLSGTNNLGPVANVVITGGSSGQALTTDGAGTLSWSTPSSAPSAITTTTISGSNSYTITSTQVGQMFVASGSNFIYLPNTSTISPGWYCYIAISGTAGANIQIPNGSVYESGTNAFGGNTHTGYWNGLSNKSIYTLTLIDSTSWIATFK